VWSDYPQKKKRSFTGLFTKLKKEGKIYFEEYKNGRYEGEMNKFFKKR